MTKILITTGAALAIAITLAGPAHAQLLHGGFGGGFGGGLGVGGGLPIGTMRGTGDLGVTGSVDGTTRSVRSTTRATQTTKTTAKAPKVAAPRLKAQALAVPTVAVPSVAAPAVTAPAVNLSAVRAPVVFVPAIPNVAVRRTAIVETGIVPVAYADVPSYVDQQYVVLQNELRGTGVQVEKQGEQIVLEMPSDVTFAFNKYDIQPRFYGVLDAVSRTLAKFPASYVDVNGHTDAVGSYRYNQSLSEMRADSVADFLAARQVNPGRMHTQGFGKTEPIASNATITGRAANRRVEIILTPYAA